MQGEIKVRCDYILRKCLAVEMNAILHRRRLICRAIDRDIDQEVVER
jgi:hypothetical protein